MRSQFANDANLEKQVLPYVVLVQALLMPRSKNSTGVYCPKYKICARLACLVQPTYPLPARCGTDTAGRGAFGPPAEDVFHSLKPCRRKAKQTNAQGLLMSTKKNAPEYATAKSKQYQLPFGSDANFCKSSRRCLKIQPKSPNFFPDMRHFCIFSLVALGIRPRSRLCAERTRQGEGRWSRPPPSRRSNEAVRPRIPVPRIAYLSRYEKKHPYRIPETNNDRM